MVGSSTDKVGIRAVWRWWSGIAGGLGLAAAILVACRGRFDYAFELIEIPAVAFAIGLGLAGLLALPLPRLIGRSTGLEARDARRLLAFVVVVGFALRAVLFVTEPILEDDYYRYLWDGGVTAHGHNPFALAPAAALEEGEETTIGRLAVAAGVVMERINHPDLKTIYPPVAQAAFAVAHLISPWSVQAWRLVCLAGEAATLALLLALLAAAARNPLWASLYWWNPLIIKEMINSGHMEAILMPLVLGALLLGVRRRPLAAVAMLGLAAGAKLWPVLLAPLLLRPLIERPKTLAPAVALLGIMMLAWAIPPWLGGIDETSGFVAFAQNWQTNSALFLAASKIADGALALLHLPAEWAALVTRGGLGLIVAAVALWIARGPWQDADDLMSKAGLVAIALFLLSPAQFPWYAAWMLPFLAFRPSLAVLALTALLPVYYTSFHFLARDQYDVFRHGLVWLIWLPVWVGLGFETWRARKRRDAERPHA
jgi:alpha-1,6-mannosyltransferase